MKDELVRFFVSNGVTKSFISSVLAPGNELIFTLLFLLINQPLMSFMILSPAITIVGLLFDETVGMSETSLGDLLFLL